jgi:hypothetical protein
VSKNNTSNPTAKGRKLREISKKETSEELAAMPSPKVVSKVPAPKRRKALDDTSTELKPYVGHVDDVNDPPFRSSKPDRVVKGARVSDLRPVVAEF